MKKKEHRPKVKKSQPTKNKRVSGVCVRIAEYFNIEPAVVRVIVVMFIILTGILPGLIVYYLISVVIAKSPYY